MRRTAPSTPSRSRKAPRLRQTKPPHSQCWIRCLTKSGGPDLSVSTAWKAAGKRFSDPSLVYLMALQETVFQARLRFYCRSVRLGTHGIAAGWIRQFDYQFPPSHKTLNLYKRPYPCATRDTAVCAIFFRLCGFMVPEYFSVVMYSSIPSVLPDPTFRSRVFPTVPMSSVTGRPRGCA